MCILLIPKHNFPDRNPWKYEKLLQGKDGCQEFGGGGADGSAWSPDDLSSPVSCCLLCTNDDDGGGIMDDCFLLIYLPGPSVCQHNHDTFHEPYNYINGQHPPPPHYR